MWKHIFDRSNLDENIAWSPKIGDITRRQHLAESGMPRADIVLINGVRSGKEYCLYVRMEGFAGDLWILDILENDEYERVTKIAEQMRQNAKEYPPAWKLLS